jgi:hypothetical protein
MIDYHNTVELAQIAWAFNGIKEFPCPNHLFSSYVACYVHFVSIVLLVVHGCFLLVCAIGPPFRKRMILDRGFWLSMFPT